MEIRNFAYSGNEITETIKNVTTTQTKSILANSLEVLLTAEPYNRTAVFHYEGVIRAAYKDERELLPNCNFSYRDRLISQHVQLTTPTGLVHYMISRGVAQYGEPQSAPENKILTKAKTLKKYEGYELGIAFTKAADIRSVELFFKSPEGRYTTIDQPIRDILFNLAEVIYLDLGDVTDDGTIIIDFEQMVQDERPIKMCKTPVHPFYVRWVNNMGGYDYHMFACNHKNSKSLDTNDLAERYGANGAMISYNREGTNKVEVSTGIVDKGTMIAIAEMIYSPDIRWYNEKLGQWIPIHPEPAELAWLEEQPTGEFILTFKLPNQQINK